MKYRDPSTGTFKDLTVKVSDTLPIGTIVGYGGATAPDGWLICDGSAVSRTLYSALFAAIGTSYGSGDGSTTFNLPDRRGRVGVGYDSTQTEFDTLGETGGSKYLQEHSHDIACVAGIEPSSSRWGVAEVTFDTNNTISTYVEGTGNSGNLQPYQVSNYIIKAFQPIAAPGEIKDSYSTSTKDAYSANYINEINTYSEEETFTGKYWADGKPIYRKVINNVSIEPGTGNAISSGISNIDTLIKLEGNLQYSSNNQWITIPSYYSSSIFITANYQYSQNKIYWDCGTFEGTGYFVLEYTKVES